MSDANALLAEMEKEGERQRVETEQYFAEQNKKFEELHQKLLDLKLENQKHMDTIVNTLDDLIASKKIVEQTLEETVETSSKLEQPDANEINLSVANLLNKITDFMDNTKELLKSTEVSKDTESSTTDSEMKDIEELDANVKRKDSKEEKAEETKSESELSETKDTKSETSPREPTQEKVEEAANLEDNTKPKEPTQEKVEEAENLEINTTPTDTEKAEK